MTFGIPFQRVHDVQTLPSINSSVSLSGRRVLIGQAKERLICHAEI